MYRIVAPLYKNKNACKLCIKAPDADADDAAVMLHVVVFVASVD